MTPGEASDDIGMVVSHGSQDVRKEGDNGKVVEETGVLLFNEGNSVRDLKKYKTLHNKIINVE